MLPRICAVCTLLLAGGTLSPVHAYPQAASESIETPSAAELTPAETLSVTPKSLALMGLALIPGFLALTAVRSLGAEPTETPQG
jgi:hypothetical protein